MADEEPKTPMELIAAFSRSSNFPRDVAGLQFLALGLVRASQQYEVPMDELVTKCLDLSAFCPTDADLMKVGAEIFEARQRVKEAKRNQESEWLEKCGPPAPFDWKALDRRQIDGYKSRETALWKALREKFKSDHGGAIAWPGWETLADAAQELGYQDFAAAWRKSVVWGS